MLVNLIMKFGKYFWKKRDTNTNTPPQCSVLQETPEKNDQVAMQDCLKYAAFLSQTFFLRQEGASFSVATQRHFFDVRETLISHPKPDRMTNMMIIIEKF